MAIKTKHVCKCVHSVSPHQYQSTLHSTTVCRCITFSTAPLLTSAWLRQCRYITKLLVVSHDTILRPLIHMLKQFLIGRLAVRVSCRIWLYCLRRRIGQLWRAMRDADTLSTTFICMLLQCIQLCWNNISSQSTSAQVHYEASPNWNFSPCIANLCYMPTEHHIINEISQSVANYYPLVVLWTAETSNGHGIG